MSISKDSLHEVEKLGKEALLREGLEHAIRTGVNDLTSRGVLASLASRYHCSEGTGRQWIGKAVREFLGARSTGRRGQAQGFSYTRLSR